MREIKFRAWDKKSCRYHTESPVSIDSTGIMSETGAFVFEQFTGLLDKNGREIYEGDCCTVTDPYNGATAGYARVVFSYKYSGGWVLTSDGENSLNIGTRTQNIEVVGNIHENPELLKEE